mmetsp:Transcript_53619/g.136062  ORF Transcript_53619/g.136062 Transcript_53619/m.136062 type:complete len:208 (+) Transcript_53619:806-1429(+)
MATQAHQSAGLGADNLALQRVADGEVQVDVVQGPDLTLQDHLSHTLGHRVARRMRALEKNLAVVLCGPLRHHGLQGVHAHRRLTEDVLARLDRLDRPLAAHRRGQDVVHGVDLRVGQHRLEAAVGLRNAPLLRVLLGLGLLQGGQADDVEPGGEVGVRLLRPKHREGHVAGRAEDAHAQAAVRHGVSRWSSGGCGSSGWLLEQNNCT